MNNNIHDGLDRLSHVYLTDIRYPQSNTHCAAKFTMRTQSTHVKHDKKNFVLNVNYTTAPPSAGGVTCACPVRVSLLSPSLCPLPRTALSESPRAAPSTKVRINCLQQILSFEKLSSYVGKPARQIVVAVSCK